MSHTTNSTDQITHFTFLPGTFRFGADPQLTVITAYLDITQELHDAVVERRTKLQTGEPVALIIAYDVEYAALQMYCISDSDTQCQIKLHPSEMIALHQSMEDAAKKIFGNTLENLLNRKRAMVRLPEIQPGEAQHQPLLHSPAAT